MVSIVVPIFNEEENLLELRRRITDVMTATGEAWELICVNDGSRDRSLALLRELHSQDPRIKVIHLSRCFGHQPAVTAGVHHALGECVILIDGDLQDPPEVIPDLLAKWREGAQVVLAERKSRPETGARGLGFFLFYPIFRQLSDLPSAPDAGIFCLMDRRVIEEFNRLPERNRFIPGLRSWLGFKQVSVYYDRQERAGGKSKQTFGRLVRYAMDGMISFSYKPLRVSTYMGFIVAAFGFVTALVFVLRRLFFHDPAVTGFTTLLSMMIFLGGVQLIAIGILGEYIGRIYEEMKQRPLYVVQEKIGIA